MTKSEELGEIFVNIIRDYHLQAAEALIREREHYPLITEARNKALKACKESGLMFVLNCANGSNRDAWDIEEIEIE